MNLESLIQIEVSQKNKYILAYIHGIQKNFTDEPICREGYRCKEWTCAHSWGRTGWDKLRK